MAKCLVGAAGGLSAADRGKLIPGNIREGVTLFEGTSKEVIGRLVQAADPVQLYSNVLGGWQRPTMSYSFTEAASSCIIFTSCAGYTGDSALDGNQTVTLSSGTLTALYNGYSNFYVGLRIKIFMAKNVPKGAVLQLRSNHSGTEGQSMAVYKVY